MINWYSIVDAEQRYEVQLAMEQGNVELGSQRRPSNHAAASFKWARSRAGSVTGRDPRCKHL